MNHKMRLHGIRYSESLAQDEDIEEIPMEEGDQLQNMAVAARRASVVSGATGRVQTASGSRAKPEPVYRRRHSISVARKNTNWAGFFLSTGANEKSIAGFLTFKEEDSAVDAEYFVTFVPKAVSNQDIVYKELLAVYNSLRYWTSKGTLKGKKLLLAIEHPDAAVLLKSAKVRGNKLGPQKVLLLKEIDELCRKNDVTYRMADLAAVPEETIIYSLVHSDQGNWKRRFQLLLTEQSHAKGAQFVAKEKLFPPVYV